MFELFWKSLVGIHLCGSLGASSTLTCYPRPKALFFCIPLRADLDRKAGCSFESRAHMFPLYLNALFGISIFFFLHLHTAALTYTYISATRGKKERSRTDFLHCRTLEPFLTSKHLKISNILHRNFLKYECLFLCPALSVNFGCPEGLHEVQ